MIRYISRFLQENLALTMIRFITATYKQLFGSSTALHTSTIRRGGREPNTWTQFIATTATTAKT